MRQQALQSQSSAWFYALRLKRLERRLPVNRGNFAAFDFIRARPILIDELHFLTFGAVFGSKFTLMGFEGFLFFSALTSSQIDR